MKTPNSRRRRKKEGFCYQVASAKPNHTRTNRVGIALAIKGILKKQDYLKNRAPPREVVPLDGAKGFQSLITGISKVAVTEGSTKGDNIFIF